MITVASLKSYSLKELAQLARKSGIADWHSMRKEQLIRALGRTVKRPVESRAKRTVSKSSKPTHPSQSTKTPAVKTPPAKLTAAKLAATKSGAAKAGGTKAGAAKVAAARAGVTKAAAAKPNAASGGSARATIAKTIAKLATVKAAVPKIAAAKAVPAKITPSSPAKLPLPKKVAAEPIARPKPPAKPRNTQVARRIQSANEERQRRRDLSQPPERITGGGRGGEVLKDRIVLLVRDPYWLQATWEVTRQSVQRAQAAMAEQWHTARPVLRLMEVENTGTTSSAERVMREIPIHGGVHNWYIDVQDPPHGFRIELGYLSSGGKFFSITRSNTVTTPRPGSADSLDENWSDVEENYEKIFAQSGGYSEETSSHELQEAFEERLQRPIGPPLASRFGVGAERILRRKRDFQFDVEAEMVVHGQTKPDAHVTLSGEPVKLREDGSFAVRMALPDKRQVIPVVASSRDGVEQRTIVIAVERNTKVMEPMIRESND